MGVLSRIRPHVLNRFGAETVEIPSWLRSSLVGYWSGGHRDNVYYPLTNIVANGNFANGTTGWATSGANIANESGRLAITATAQYGGGRQTITTVVGRTYYYTVTLEGTTDNYVLIVGIGASSKALPSNGTHKITILFTATGTSHILQFSDSRASGWTKFWADNAMIYDLSASPGAGIEPTLTDLDAILAADGTNYWDGTRNILCNPASKYYWADYSGNARHGKLTNFAYATGSNLDQYGAYFDGVDDYISIADSPALRLTAGGTLWAWINPKSIGETAGRIFDKSIGSYSFGFNTDNRLWGNINAGVDLYSANNTLVLGTWQFVAMTFNSTGRRLYKNAANVTASGGAEIALPANAAGIVAIGNRSTATDRTFDGQIGLAGICTRALTASEIRYLFEATRRKYGV